eukprot:364501-Chlamydomonas_euryale.AAC.8
MWDRPCGTAHVGPPSWGPPMWDRPCGTALVGTAHVGPPMWDRPHDSITGPASLKHHGTVRPHGSIMEPLSWALGPRGVLKKPL